MNHRLLPRVLTTGMTALLVAGAAWAMGAPVIQAFAEFVAFDHSVPPFTLIDGAGGEYRVSGVMTQNGRAVGQAMGKESASCTHTNPLATPFHGATFGGSINGRVSVVANLEDQSGSPPGIATILFAESRGRVGYVFSCDGVIKLVSPGIATVQARGLRAANGRIVKLEIDPDKRMTQVINEQCEFFGGALVTIANEGDVELVKIPALVNPIPFGVTPPFIPVNRSVQGLVAGDSEVINSTLTMICG